MMRLEGKNAEAKTFIWFVVILACIPQICLAMVLCALVDGISACWAWLRRR